MAAVPSLSETAPAAAARSHAASRKTLVRRPERDRSQVLRLSFQLVFVLINLAIGLQFVLFVRYVESGGTALRVSRPPGVEGWLPIAGLMNLKYLLVTGSAPALHPAAMVLLAAFLAISIVFRKSFCSWLCPVGTLSEAIWKLGRNVLRKNWRVPRPLDIGLRSLKYLLLALFVYAIAVMSASSIHAFMASPYGLVADIKMLNFFRFLGQTGALTILALAVLSFFFQNFWCRYLCPYGALMGLASLLSPVKIRRDPDACIDCAKCARACPALLPVDRLAAVRSAECTACLECVAVCPAKGALGLALPRKRHVPVWALAAGISILFLGAVAFARAAGVWHSPIPDAVYFHLISRIGELAHP